MGTTTAVPVISRAFPNTLSSPRSTMSRRDIFFFDGEVLHPGMNTFVYDKVAMYSRLFFRFDRCRFFLLRGLPGGWQQAVQSASHAVFQWITFAHIVFILISTLLLLTPCSPLPRCCFLLYSKIFMPFIGASANDTLSRMTVLNTLSQNDSLISSATLLLSVLRLSKLGDDNAADI